MEPDEFERQVWTHGQTIGLAMALKSIVGAISSASPLLGLSMRTHLAALLDEAERAQEHPQTLALLRSVLQSTEETPSSPSPT